MENVIPCRALTLNPRHSPRVPKIIPSIHKSTTDKAFGFQRGLEGLYGHMRSYRYCGIRYSCAEFYSDTDMQSHPCLRHAGEFFQTRGPSGESPPPTITYPSIHHAIVGGRDFTGVGFLTEGSTLSVPRSLSLYLCLMFPSLFPSVCLAGRLSVSLALTLCLSLCLCLCQSLYLSLSLPLPLSPSLSLSRSFSFFLST